MSYLNNNKYCTTDIIAKEHLKELNNMKLHGQYFVEQTNIPDEELKLSRQWLKHSHLRFETKSLICAGQEQIIKTRFLQNKIWKINCSPMCQLCKQHPEKIAHIISGCNSLAATNTLSETTKLQNIFIGIY